MSKRILIVEDEPTLLFAIWDYLDQWGYEVDAASELEEATALLMNLHYDLVITDMRLTPLQSAEGLHVIELVHDRLLSARLIVLTGLPGHEIETAIARLGVDRVIRKPVPLAVLADVVSELLQEVVC